MILQGQARQNTCNNLLLLYRTVKSGIIGLHQNFLFAAQCFPPLSIYIIRSISNSMARFTFRINSGFHFHFCFQAFHLSVL